MKNKIFYAMALGCLLSFNACDVLDTEDLSHYSPDDVWNDSKLASAYLSDLYAGAFNGWPVDGGNSDECKGILGTTTVQPNNNNFKYWPYAQIRDINMMIEGVNTGSLTPEQKNGLLGQAYFLRAWHYFLALRMHGGVPIVKTVQKETDDLNVKRNSSLECFDFIISDLDEAAKLLPIKSTGADYGRIDQCIVAAFKGRVLLYKASPQFNPSKPYDNAYIEEAYEATKFAKEFLEKNGFGLVDNYTAVFETEKHKEAVLPIIYTAPSKTNGRWEDAVRPLSESKNMTGYDVPTWGLAEAFPMKDGKKPGESTKYVYDLQHFWENRDPRFDATIVYNASVYELSGKIGRRQYTTPGIASSLDAFGYDIQGEHGPQTGLFCKKGIMEELPIAQVTQNDVDWLEIRYAEVLFNYAEMANEKGFTEVAYDVLKQIRQRAGIEPGDDNLYGLKANMSVEEMRQALLDEKRIEFCFEGQRFWDLRRHRLLHSFLNGQHKFGCLATLKPGISMQDAMERARTYTLLPDEFVYKAEDLQFQDPNAENAMYTPETYYFFPISKGEIEKNPNLEQNEGWGGHFKGELP